MGKVKALLIGVSKYKFNDDLPLCDNDVRKINETLIKGLNVEKKDICLGTEDGFVSFDNFVDCLTVMKNKVEKEDIFIFYFSGHGGNNVLCLSEENIQLDIVIDLIEKMKAKSKIILLDSCRSGDFLIDNAELKIEHTVNDFASHGCAVFASCNAMQSSSFNDERHLSIFTGFLSDAFIYAPIVNGKKSLEDIQRLVFRYAKNWNTDTSNYYQTPIFRSNIGGTIYFDVEEYTPYMSKEIYIEKEKFILYMVEPCHTLFNKRYAVKVILKQKIDYDCISNITLELFELSKNFDVYSNLISEERLHYNEVETLFCYFGYDEEDMIHGNFAFRSAYTIDDEIKNRMPIYSESSKVISNVNIWNNESYSSIKASMSFSRNKNSLIEKTKEYTQEMINLAEKYIKYFREFENQMIGEQELKILVMPISKRINEIFILQGDLPIPPVELNDWSKVHSNLACSINNMTFAYNDSAFLTRNSKNRKRLALMYILHYQKDLEKLSKIDASI